MSCDGWVEAISAISDGEDPAIAPELVDRHVETCAECRTYQRDVAATRPRMRIGLAQPIPNLAPSVAKAAAVADRSSRWFLFRVMLALVAAQIIALSAPALLLGDETGTSPHGARHLGAFSVAYAVGLLVVVARPARARTMLPVAQVLCAAIVISALVDVLDGSVGISAEVAHLPEVVSVLLLWVLAVPPYRHPRRHGRLPLQLRNETTDADRLRDRRAN